MQDKLCLHSTWLCQHTTYTYVNMYYYVAHELNTILHVDIDKSHVKIIINLQKYPLYKKLVVLNMIRHTTPCWIVFILQNTMSSSPSTVACYDLFDLYNFDHPIQKNTKRELSMHKIFHTPIFLSPHFSLFHCDISPSS